jgi:hypothetical protein
MQNKNRQIKKGYVRMSSEDFKSICDVLFNDDKNKPLVSFKQQTRKETLRIY